MNSQIAAIGASIVDFLLPIKGSKELFKDSKGGMELVSFDDFQKIVKHFGPPKNITSGGSAANMIKALAKLGVPALFTGCIGDDTSGKFFRDEMERHGANLWLSHSPKQTSESACLITDEGERTMRTFVGASADLSFENIPFDKLEKVKLLHLEGYLLMKPSLFDAIFKAVKERNIPLSLDLSSFEVVRAYKQKIIDLLPDLELLVANEDEAYALTQLKPSDAGRLLQSKVKTVIILSGKEGCYIASENEFLHDQAYKAKVVDTTGAGDFFLSGYLFAALRGAPLEDRARLGNFLASRVIEYYGSDLPDSLWQTLLKSLN